MKKVLILILIPLISLGIFLFFKHFLSINKLTSENTQSNSGSQSKLPFPDPLYSNSINQGGESVKNAASQTLDNAKNNIYKTIQSDLNNLFGQSPSNQSSSEVVQVVDSSAIPKSSDQLTLIDLAKDSNVRIKLIKGKKNYLQFQNVPNETCLYVGESKYPVNTDKLLEIEILKSGIYPLKINSCNLNDKNIGEIDVE